MTETELRAAALQHASLPHDVPGMRERSPLLLLIPDDTHPTPETWALAEEVIGSPIPRCSGASASWVRAARLRAALNRWGIKQVGIIEVRDHVRAREMYRSMTST